MSDSDLIRYPFFTKIIDNLKKIIDPKDNDLDITMLFIYLYWYSCKYLKHHNKEVSSENIYQIMESLYRDRETRDNLFSLFRENTLQLKN